MRLSIRDIPWFGFATSLSLIVGPLPAYLFLVIPVANTTRDPDAIEFLAFFLVPVVMLAGAAVGVAALRDWKANKEVQNRIYY